MPTGAVNFLTLASTRVEGANETNWFSGNFDPRLLRSGTNFLAVEMHQFTNDSSDIWLDLHLAAQPTNAPPRLLATRNSGLLTLQWPAWAAGFALYSTTNLALPVNWMPVTNAVATTNSQLAVAVENALQFFQLRPP